VEKIPQFEKSKYLYTQTSLSLMTVVFSAVLELLPRIRAKRIRINIAPPRTHTHGCVYHVVVVVVVVVVFEELEPVLSWANKTV
jgi:hypothetical protein